MSRILHEGQLRKFVAILNAMAVVVLFRATNVMAAANDGPLEKESQQFVEQTVRAITRNWDEQEIWDRAAPELGQRERAAQIKDDLAVARSNLGMFIEYRWADGTRGDTAAATSAVYIARAKFENGDAVFDLSLVKHGGNWGLSFIRVLIERSCPSEQHRDPFKPTWTKEASPRPAEITISAQLAEGEATLQRREFEPALLALHDAFYSNQYEQFSSAIQYRVDIAYGQAAFGMGELREAHLASIRATAIPNAPLDAWTLRMTTAASLGDYQDAYTAFKAVRDDCSVSYAFTAAQVVAFDAWFGTLPNSPDAQLDFERYLETTRWKPRDPIATLDIVNFHYAQNLLAAGDGRKAFQIASAITLPITLATAAADKRFDGAFADVEPAELVKKSADDRLSKFQRMVQRDPRWMEARNAVAIELETLGRSDEALEQVNDTLNDAAHLSVADRQRYNFAIEYERALSLKAHLLFDLGSYDEAIETEAKIASQHRIQPDIGISLLLSKWLIALGRGAEALHELSSIPDEKLSLTGRIDAAGRRGCAASQTGDTAIVEESIRYLKQRPVYGTPALLQVYLCANDLDAAADAIVTGVENPRSRALMLSEIQLYKKPKAVPDFQQTLDDRLAQVRSMTRVMDAIHPIGRINTYEIAYPGRVY